MLEFNDGKIIELSTAPTFSGMSADSFTAGSTMVVGNVTNCFPDYSYPYNQTIWQSYPVYVCTDKTAKAIEILKSLQADKAINVTSVPKFIEMVEKISKIL